MAMEMQDAHQVARLAIIAIEPVLGGREPGYYLHGSAASRSMTPTSDIDLLILCSSALTEHDRAHLDDVLQDPRLDVKAFSWSEFAADPWADLDAAVHLYGRDWRPDMPRPTVDQRAREAVLMVCAATRDGRAPSRKYVGWLISALLAATHGYVPASRQAALVSLDRFEATRAEALRALAQDVAEPERVADLESEVLDLLREQARTRGGPLGPACWLVIDNFLTP